jgi:hypothetical protein
MTCSGSEWAYGIEARCRALFATRLGISCRHLLAQVLAAD